MLLADRLRADTRTHHDAVERGSPMAWLMAPGLDRATYAAVLARLAAFQAPAEAALAPHLVALGLDPIDRAGRAARDLAALGHPAPDPAPADALPRLATAADARGVAYVLEGAALGGQVIARHVGALLGLSAGDGLSFFASDGAPAGPRWRAVRRMLDEAPDADHAAAVDAARDTFDRMGEWMRGVGAPEALAPVAR